MHGPNTAALRRHTEKSSHPLYPINLLQLQRSSFWSSCRRLLQASPPPGVEPDPDGPPSKEAEQAAQSLEHYEDPEDDRDDGAYYDYLHGADGDGGAGVAAGGLNQTAAESLAARERLRQQASTPEDAGDNHFQDVEEDYYDRYLAGFGVHLV